MTMNVPGRIGGTGVNNCQRQGATLILLLLLSLLISACTGLSEYDTAQIESSLRDSLLTTHESWDVNLALMENSLRRVAIQGDHSITYQPEDRDETLIEGGVYVRLFDDEGELEAEARSLRAIYHADAREFELFDSVRVSTDQRRLYTEYLKWSQETDRITSDRFVTIITPEDSLTGSGFSSNTDLTRSVIRNLRGEVTVD
ncbi:MAG: LPS export ABC transporter periplasmic protein LptC [Balneolaceae bacterium]